MKPPPFRYHDPTSLAAALEILAERDNAQLLAGGQSLMPMLNMRFVQPDDVIDLNKVADLSGISQAGGPITIGAMTRQRDLERSEVIRRTCPIMGEALRQVGHRQTRSRGTIGGSLCHLDPAAELPVVATALEATVRVESKRGARSLAMADFPAFYMTPAIDPDEIVTAVEFEPWPERHGYAFMEFARRHGDFAVVGVAVLLELAGDAEIRRASVVLGGVGPSPVRGEAAEAVLVGNQASPQLLEQAAETGRGIEAMGDVHASSAYRQHLAVVLTRRALDQALERARGAPGNGAGAAP